ncbi:MAG: hypothetical protein ABIZ81_01925 [Opitutaceae bacterium]
MNVYGFELCDAGCHAALNATEGTEVVELQGTRPGLGWPAVAQQRTEGFAFGDEAERAWFVHPRSVSHLFWEKLSHDPADLAGATRPPSFSQLAFHFLQDYLRRVTAVGGAPQKAVLAVPGFFLRDPATEEEKIGLLLGMAGELGLPLAGIVDMACAAFGGPAASAFPRDLAILHVDVHLHATEISLLRHEEKIVRQHYQHVPQAGYAQILRHLKNAMGNRFLRQTAFDIHEDRRLEQAFYEQTKNFLFDGSRNDHEFHYQLNTEKRSYQMTVTRSQLTADLQAFDQTLAQAVVAMSRNAGEPPARCAVSLSDRAARLDGLETSLRAVGFARIFRLRPGAAAMGAAALAEEWPVVADLADVPVEIAVPRRGKAGEIKVETTVRRAATTGSRPAPSHVVLDGIGYGIGVGGISLGTSHTRTAVDIALPETFDVVGDYILRMVRDGEQLSLELPAQDAAADGDKPARLAVDTGDRLTLRGAGAVTELFFVHCGPVANGAVTSSKGAAPCLPKNAGLWSCSVCRSWTVFAAALVRSFSSSFSPPGRNRPSTGRS